MVTPITEVRHQAGLSQTEAAALARVSPHTWKTFELSPDAVTPKKRRACEQALAEIKRRAEAA
jgi:hypothetical protein